jgi:hypothetical protein
MRCSVDLRLGSGKRWRLVGALSWAHLTQKSCEAAYCDHSSWAEPPAGHFAEEGGVGDPVLAFFVPSVPPTGSSDFLVSLDLSAAEERSGSRPRD